MSSSMRSSESTEPREHLVQFYSADEHSLIKNVRTYLWSGMQSGEGLLVIATEEHWTLLTRSLRSIGADLEDGRIVFLDAQSALTQLMVNGQPDWDRFEGIVGSAMRQLRSRQSRGDLRAYGEMVGLLWKSKLFSAAIRLEEFWNKLLVSGGFKLYCAYPIDVFDKDFQMAGVDAVLRAHTHLMPVGENGDLDLALNRAMEERPGPGADRLRTFVSSGSPSPWAEMPKAEAAILSLRRMESDYADEVLARAREHYHGEKRFRALIENSSDAIFLLDAHGKVLYASSSTAKVLGYEPRDLVGRSYLEITHPDDRQRAARTLQEALAKPAVAVEVQTRLSRKDGQWSWVESNTSNLLDEPDVRAIVSNYRDITDRKLAEEKTHRDAEELLRYNTELQAFAYAVAHDLKEPLRTVCAYTQLLTQRAALGDDSKEFAEFIVGGVSRMSRLLDDLLSLTRLTFTDPPSRIELNDIVEQSISNMEHTIQENGATIRVAQLPLVSGNESYLVQVFQNLISNAVKYRSKAAPEIDIAAEPLGTRWMVKIADNGIGVAEQYHEHIFGLFKRLNGGIDGTGIGLAICRKIVEGAGGKIWVESEPGKGSTFCFTVAAA